MDKQIIIDGVDVSGCYYYSKGKCLGCYMLNEKDCISCYGVCKEINDCHYKQLIRKEQECEELKLEINGYVTITDECLRLDNKRLADEKRDLQQQLEQLKAELEQEKNQHSILKKMFADIDKANTGLHNKLNQLKVENGKFRKANDEKNELLAKLGCPTTATAKRQVFCLQEQLDQLKAKDKRLEAHLATLDAVIETGKAQYKTLEQTLADIKEIVENGKRFAERYMITGEQKANVLTYANAILQKISEVENEI